MAKISTYAIDSTPTLADKLIGTDVNDSDITKNFLVGDIVKLQQENLSTDYIPIWDGTKFVDSLLFQNASTGGTSVTVSGLVSQINIGQSAYFGLGAGTVDTFAFSKNVGIGYGALNNFTAGEFGGVPEDGVNVAVGHNALQQTTTGTNNIAIGGGSLQYNNAGFNNVAISKNALGDDNAQYTSNNTSIGIGFSAGNQNINSPMGLGFDGHVGSVYLGHQAFADFSLSDVSSVSIEGNVVIGRRAFRNAGLSGNKRLRTFIQNTIIGDNAGINLDTTSTINDTPYTFSENVYIGRNAGANNDPGSKSVITGNVIIGKLFGGAHDIGNIVVTAGTDPGSNTLGVPSGGANDSNIVSNNIVLGCNNKVFGNNNVSINMYNDVLEKVQIGKSANGDPLNPSSENVVLGSYSIKVLEGNTYFANKNTIVNSQSVTVNASQGKNAIKNLVLNSHGSSTTDHILIKGASNTLLNAENFSLESTPANILSGDGNFIVGANGGAIVGQNASGNTMLNTDAASLIIQSDNNFLTGHGSTITNGTNLIGFNTVFGKEHTLATTQNCTVSGISHNLADVNHAFVSGNANQIASGSANSIALLGRGLITGNTAEGCLIIGRFNDSVNAAAQAQGDSVFQVGVGVGQGAGARENALNIVNTGGQNSTIYMDGLVGKNYADDTAAAAAGVLLGGLYHTDGVVKINITP